MPYEYAAENHDWDLTLRASWNLLMSGQAASQVTTLEKRTEQVFSFFTGSMLLAFCAIESFTTSVAFSMSSDHKFKGFDFDGYKKTRRFWEKLEMVCTVLDQPIDKSRGLFQTLNEMQIWRNALTHFSPYEIEATEIQDTVREPPKLHTPFRNKEYTQSVTVKNAKKFYSTACEYIDLIKNASGIDPRARCSYRVI
jgi:hypothetical protein